MEEQLPKSKEWKWPYGILLVYLIFVTSTIAFVVFTFTVKTDLVVDEYYEKTLVYQDQIDRERNALELSEPLQISIIDSNLEIIFPQEHHFGSTEGTISLYRPSNSSLDEVKLIEIDENGHQLIDLSSIQKGVWKVQVLWNYDGVEYYKESTIFLR
jgi:hypothetical protein